MEAEDAISFPDGSDRDEANVLSNEAGKSLSKSLEDVIPFPNESDRDEANGLSHEVSEAGDDGEGLRQSLEDVISLPDESDRKEAYGLSHEVGEGGESSRQSLDAVNVEEGQFVSKAEVFENVVNDSFYTYKEADVNKTADTRISGDVAAPFKNGCLNDSEVEEGQLSDMDTDGNDAASLSMLNEKIGIDTLVAESILEADVLPSENGCMAELPVTNVVSTSGVKRTRTTVNEQQASVQVKYCGLSRESKRKLEELMREWSEWHAKSSRRQDDYVESETGEEIYFPALHIGTGKNSAVSFWIENEIRKPEDNDVIPVEDAYVPLYDRGFTLGSISADGSSNLEGFSEFMDAPRCFNCSSYSHALKECPKPRDNDAVNNSRKQLKSKRNQTAGTRNPTRYYQDSPGGKYEGLRPGSLDAETRRLLGLEESDPPPWLNRMREIGYPPGYLEPEVESLPSGITIFADEEIKEEKEDGEILEAEVSDVPKKESVNYPGVNAPIPNNADEKVWAARSSNPDRHRNGDSGRSNHSSESDFRGRYREKNYHDFRDDPLSFDRCSRYASRHDDHNFSSSSRNWREEDSRPRSPSYGRSTGERGRNDPLDSEDAVAYSLYSSFSYSSDRRPSERNNEVDNVKGDRTDHTPRSWDRDDRHRHRKAR